MAFQLDPSNALLLGFPEYGPAAERLAAATGLPRDDVEVHVFPDGESRVRLPPELPPWVILCRSLDRPNAKLVELGLAAVTARRLGARRLTLVAPYLCYMRQDRAFRPGEAVSQHVVGAWLAQCFDDVVTVDPHLHRTPRLEQAVPASRALALSAAPALAAWLRGQGASPLLLGPDEESGQWVGTLAEFAGLDYAVARKVRLGDREVRLELPASEMRGRSVLLVDDVASTGHTLATAAAALRRAGAGPVRALVTHAILPGHSAQQLAAAGVEELWSSDSVPHSSNRVQLAELLAAGLGEL
jgi:ribose-phosphate pyrophosphokinase